MVDNTEQPGPPVREFELDRLFGRAEQRLREGRYDDAIKLYRTFALRVEENDEGHPTSDCSEGGCIVCGWPLGDSGSLEGPEYPSKCRQCTEKLEQFEYIDPSNLEHYRDIAIRTAVSLTEGEVGLNWTQSPPKDDRFVDSEDLGGIDITDRDVAISLLSLSQELGRVPTPRDAYESDDFDPGAVFALFDSWGTALDAAGLDVEAGNDRDVPH